MSDNEKYRHLLHEDPDEAELVERVVPRKPELDADWDKDAELDTTDVHLEDADLWGPTEPAWVIRGEYFEEEIGTIKSGKEADVRLVRRVAGARSCLLAHKRFRPRAQRAFRREEDYRAGQGFGDERVDRAVGRRSRFGRSVLEYAWAYREFPLMLRAWEAGVRVPFPVDPLRDGLVMQYLGDLDEPAPRLVNVRLDAGEAELVLDDIVDNMHRLLGIGLVHADLSAYNILWSDGRPWLIDFPQAVDIAHSPRGVEFLRRDVANVCAYFRRLGVHRDPIDVFEELMREAPFAWHPGAP